MTEIHRTPIAEMISLLRGREKYSLPLGLAAEIADALELLDAGADHLRKPAITATEALSIRRAPPSAAELYIMALQRAIEAEGYRIMVGIEANEVTLERVAADGGTTS